MSKNGGPAMPIVAGNQVYGTGISKLEFFAAAALTGLLSDPDNWDEKVSYVQDAFNIAAAMLAESERRSK